VKRGKETSAVKHKTAGNYRPGRPNKTKQLKAVAVDFIYRIITWRYKRLYTPIKLNYNKNSFILSYCSFIACCNKPKSYEVDATVSRCFVLFSSTFILLSGIALQQTILPIATYISAAWSKTICLSSVAFVHPIRRI